MKTYTDIEQSKKLKDILPFESADMFWLLEEDYGVAMIASGELEDWGGDCAIPCWSLAALIDQMNKNSCRISLNNEYDLTWSVEFNDGKTKRWTYDENPIDACYEMIINLHEQNLL